MGPQRAHPPDLHRQLPGRQAGATLGRTAPGRYPLGERLDAGPRPGLRVCHQPQLLHLPGPAAHGAPDQHQTHLADSGPHAADQQPDPHPSPAMGHSAGLAAAAPLRSGTGLSHPDHEPADGQTPGVGYGGAGFAPHPGTGSRPALPVHRRGQLEADETARQRLPWRVLHQHDGPLPGPALHPPGPRWHAPHQGAGRGAPRPDPGRERAPLPRVPGRNERQEAAGPTTADGSVHPPGGHGRSRYRAKGPIWFRARGSQRRL
jgi:hypothetical protein